MFKTQMKKTNKSSKTDEVFRVKVQSFVGATPFVLDQQITDFLNGFPPEFIKDISFLVSPDGTKNIAYLQYYVKGE